MPVLALNKLRDVVCSSAAAFDTHVLDQDTAAAAAVDWSTIAHAAEAAFALAAARVAACGPPAAAGASSPEDFLAKATGTTSARAKEAMRSGHGLQTNTTTRAVATSGRLSPEQTAAITDAIAVNPDAEGDLLHSAKHNPVSELRADCARAKAAVSNLEQIEARIHAGRRVRRWTDSEGAEHLHAVGTKRDMARIDQALKPFVEDVFKKARTNGVREPLEAYAFDALVGMADQSIDGDQSTRPRKRRANPVRSLAVLRADFAALVRGHVDGDETCEIAGLGPVSVRTAREMLGESLLKLVITNGVDVVNMTHLGRGPNLAQKIALLWRQPLCTRKGCGRTARLEYDHGNGHEYRITQHTRLDETDPLCEPDHDLKTFHGWALVEGAGTREMVPPDDPRHPATVRWRGPAP